MNIVMNLFRLLFVAVIFLPCFLRAGEVVFDWEGVENGKVILWALPEEKIASLSPPDNIIHFGSLDMQMLFENAKQAATDPEIRRVTNREPAFSKTPSDLEDSDLKWEFFSFQIKQVDLAKSWIENAEPRFTAVLFVEVKFRSRDNKKVECSVFVLEDGTVVPRIKRGLTKSELDYFRELK